MILSAVIICYLIGSIPFGYILGRLLKGIDIRKHGSGNIGATNALRALGKAPGAAVLLLDALKGFVCIFFIGWYLSALNISIDGNIYFYIAGLSAIIGHNWPIYLRFKGGKGVAVTLGVLLGLSCYISEVGITVLILIGVWILLTFLSRAVSLGSLIAALSLPVVFLIFYILDRLSLSAVVFSLLACIFIIVRHKENISNLLEKRERKVNL